jgi:hypothetical protein
MPLSFDANGLQIQTYGEILEEVQADFVSAWGSAIATRFDSAAGQLQRILALRIAQAQEKLLQLVHSFDPRLAEGTSLDQRNSLIGVIRTPATYGRVLATITGTPATSIPDGTRVSVGGYVFATSGGPYVIGGGGTVGSVLLVAQLAVPIVVSTLGAWTIVDSVSGFTSINDDSQPVFGNALETDAAYRARAEIERYRRASGPLVAIEAAVSAVEGVTYVRAEHNVDPANDPDANGIGLHEINVVVVGGDDTEVAQAIQDSGPAGHRFIGAEEVTLGSGANAEVVGFDRVTEITLWIDVVATTSTSEEEQVDDLPASALAALLAYTTANWGIGSDVLPARLAGVVADLQGVDAAAVEVSIDDGAADAYSTAKRVITIRQQAVAIAARITIAED